jgi:DNA polymerase III gamma/tau subunit
MLKEMGRNKRIPHALLLTGPSGCGKTTTAYILRRALKCSDIDFHEKNVANFRGIDMVREIQRRVSSAPLGGGCRVWLIDECAKLTPDAQDAFLKLLEEPPDHAYFFLCTTDPGKLKRTIITRCTELKFKLLDSDQVSQLLGDVAGKESFELDEDVSDRIVTAADGSARKALVLLNQAMGRETVDEQLQAIAKADYKAQAVEVARGLLSRAGWKSMAKTLANVEDEAETVRRIVLAYCSKVLLGGGKPAARAHEIIDMMRDPFYDNGVAGLIDACWELVHGSGD